MTYQATGRGNVSYGRNANRNTNMYNIGNSRTVRNAIAPERKKAEALSREEMLSIREAEMRRRKRAEAEKKSNPSDIKRMQYDISRAKAYEAEMKREGNASKKAEKAKRREASRLAAESALRDEIKVERQKMPWQFILCVAIAFTLLMAMIYSFAQISESNRELAQIKEQISVAEDKADKLKLQLEEKNDLTMIEKIATEQYNMVKEGSVQKKYISISEGDRVVLDTVVEEEKSGFMNGMMSSAASVFDDILDYIK